MGLSLDAIIVAILSMIGTVSGSYISNRKSQALIAYRLEQLESKVNLHNNLIERTYKLEQTTTLQDEKLKETNRRVEALERA
ncbi:MAG: hypothetical protein IIY21_00335 [Clostridiales bacterium]|nr:hypothetical protein [Clostridiales bacterium]MBQ1572381.1 hypothetical protein [Clostridiales bacterium]